MTAMENNLQSMPSDANIVGDIHTHGGDEDVRKYNSQYYREANRFSDQDRDVYRNKVTQEDGSKGDNQYGKKVIGYVVTPNGRLFEYDPNANYQRGRDFRFPWEKPFTSEGIPSDPASKTLRLNNIDPVKMPSVLPQYSVWPDETPKSIELSDYEKRKGY